MISTRRIHTLVLSGTLLIGACAPATQAASGVGQGPRVETAAAPSAAPYVQADVDFMQGMLHHHAQAIVMTDLIEGRAADPRVQLMGRRIELSQEGEMEMMVRWLERRGEEVPDLAHAHHGAHAHMPGMLSPEQLERLAAASGPEFDRLFLEYMIQHHEGAPVVAGDHAQHDRPVEVHDGSADLGAVLELEAAQRLR